ncbi:MAG: type II secretion system F family protein [Firmicutes bacterium]|nr:type II secretion system F family protein [Bacillota bacterium]
MKGGGNLKAEALAAVFTGLAVAVPGLIAALPTGKNEVKEVLCRTGLKFVSEEERSVIGKKLIQAGVSNVTPELFAGARLGLCIVFLSMALPLLLGGMDSLILMLFAPAVWLLANMWLNGRINSRKRRLRLSLPNFGVYLSTALSAGAGITLALEVAAKNAGEPLASEVDGALRDNDFGTELTEALDDMAERCDVDELKNLMRAITQSYHYGSALAETVRNYINQMRTVRRLEIMESAGKLTVKMVIPVLVFILGPCLVTLLYPAAVNILEALAR